jgi:hypothetical protein
MILLKRGYRPSNLEERMVYSAASHRRRPEENLYLQNKSVGINCYDKHTELEKNFPNCPNIDDAKNVVRFEVQCKYPKVYSMSKIMSNVMKDKLARIELINLMLSDEISEDTIQKYYRRCVGNGDYYTLEMAIKIVRNQNFQDKKTHRLIKCLEHVNRCRGIGKSINSLSHEEVDNFKRSLKELEGIRINPVTIPREWGISRVPGFMNAYMDYIASEHAKILFEKAEREMLRDYFND